jgi:hypothetical protein
MFILPTCTFLSNYYSTQKHHSGSGRIFEETVILFAQSDKSEFLTKLECLSFLVIKHTHLVAYAQDVKIIENGQLGDPPPPLKFCLPTLPTTHLHTFQKPNLPFLILKLSITYGELYTCNVMYT